MICGHCGTEMSNTTASHHYWNDCAAVLKRRITELEAELNTERMLTKQLNKNLQVFQAMLSTMDKMW